MVRSALVSVIEAPYVPDVRDFVVTAGKELFEVLSRFDQLWQPDQGWKVNLSSWNVCSS